MGQFYIHVSVFTKFDVIFTNLIKFESITKFDSIFTKFDGIFTKFDGIFTKFDDFFTNIDGIINYDGFHQIGWYF